MNTMSRLLTFLKPFSGQILLSVLASAITITSSIGLLGTSAYLISMAALQPSIAVLQVAIVGVRFFGITRGLSRYAERLLSHSVNLQLLSRLRTWFFKSVEPHVPAGLIHIQQGDLLSRSMADIESLEHFFIRVVSPPLTAVLIVAGTAAYLSHFSLTLSIILVIGAVVSGAVIPLSVYWINRRQNQNLPSQQSQLTVDLLDYLQGHGDLLIAGQEPLFRERLKQKNALLVKEQYRVNLTGSLFTSLHLLTINITMMAVLLEGVRLVTDGTVNGVMLGAFALITLAAFEATQPLINSALFLHKTVKAAGRLFELTEQQPAVSEPGQPIDLPHTYDLAIEELTFNYPESSQPILERLNLEIKHGSQVALVGKSGSGKTTLANLLLRFWEFDRGSIKIGETDIRTLTGSQARSLVTVIDQSGYIFDSSVRDNLTLGNEAIDDSMCIETIKGVALANWFSGLPDGLDTRLGERGTAMSAGERRRLNLARAFLRQTPIYIFDEPTADLDAETANQLLSTLLELAKGATVLWITHSLTNLEQLDCIYVLDEGKIVESGSHAELIKANSKYAKLLAIQKGTIPA